LLEILRTDAGLRLRGEMTHQNLLSLLNVKYLASCLPVYGEHLQEVHRDGEYRLYRNESALPRVAWVPHYRVVPDPRQRLAVLADSSFDFASTAVLERPPVSAVLPPSASNPETAVIDTRSAAGCFDIEAATPADGLLLLTESFYPGWRAWVDGERVEILRADHVYQGIWLPQGRHVVRFQYLPTRLREGAWLSGAGLLVWCVGAGWVMIRGRRGLQPALG
jgi:uncharacterized membrane protein YfhO